MVDGLVELRDVSRVLPIPGGREVVAVRNVTARIAPGERIAIVGRSGSGKTTLLHLAAGLDRPTSGTVTWPTLGERGPAQPGVVGVVFQTPSLIPWLTVEQNVAVPMLAEGREYEATRESIGRVLEACGVATIAQRLPDEISGGQAQRVATARALVMTPALVLGDEPTGQLDRATATSLIRHVLDVSGAETAVVVATHDDTVAEMFPERWRMSHGTLQTA